MKERLQPHGPEVAEVLGLVATMAQYVPDQYALARLTYLHPRQETVSRRLPRCELELGVSDPRLTLEEQIAADDEVLGSYRQYASANNIPTQLSDHYLPRLQVAPSGLPGFDMLTSIHTTNAALLAGPRRLRAAALISATLDNIVKVVNVPVDSITISPSENKSTVTVGHVSHDTLAALHSWFGDRISVAAARVNTASLHGDTCFAVQNRWTTPAAAFHLRFLTHDAAAARGWLAALPGVTITDRLPRPKRRFFSGRSRRQ